MNNNYYTNSDVNSLLLLKADITYVDSQDLNFFNQASTLISVERDARIQQANDLIQQIQQAVINSEAYTDSQINIVSSLLTSEKEARIASDEWLQTQLGSLAVDLSSGLDTQFDNLTNLISIERSERIHSINDLETSLDASLNSFAHSTINCNFSIFC